MPEKYPVGHHPDCSEPLPRPDGRRTGVMDMHQPPFPVDLPEDLRFPSLRLHRRPVLPEYGIEHPFESQPGYIPVCLGRHVAGLEIPLGKLRAEHPVHAQDAGPAVGRSPGMDERQLRCIRPKAPGHHRIGRIDGGGIPFHKCGQFARGGRRLGVQRKGGRKRPGQGQQSYFHRVDNIRVRVFGDHPSAGRTKPSPPSRMVSSRVKIIIFRSTVPGGFRLRSAKNAGNRPLFLTFVSQYPTVEPT